jgi:hypothetical protein
MKVLDSFILQKFVFVALNTPAIGVRRQYPAAHDAIRNIIISTRDNRISQRIVPVAEVRSLNDALWFRLDPLAPQPLLRIVRHSPVLLGYTSI